MALDGLTSPARHRTLPLLHTVCLVAIVRDEESNPSGGIQLYLNRILSYCHSALIVDTGSQDGTLNILQQAMKQYAHMHVRQCEFISFAQARNYALQQAMKLREQQQKEWDEEEARRRNAASSKSHLCEPSHLRMPPFRHILFLDADEELTLPTLNVLSSILSLDTAPPCPSPAPSPFSYPLCIKFRVICVDENGQLVHRANSGMWNPRLFSADDDFDFVNMVDDYRFERLRFEERPIEKGKFVCLQQLPKEIRDRVEALMADMDDDANPAATVANVSETWEHKEGDTPPTVASHLPAASSFTSSSIHTAADAPSHFSSNDTHIPTSAADLSRPASSASTSDDVVESTDEINVDVRTRRAVSCAGMAMAGLQLDFVTDSSPTPIRHYATDKDDDDTSQRPVRNGSAANNQASSVATATCSSFASTFPLPSSPRPSSYLPADLTSTARTPLLIPLRHYIPNVAGRRRKNRRYKAAAAAAASHSDNVATSDTHSKARIQPSLAIEPTSPSTIATTSSPMSPPVSSPTVIRTPGKPKSNIIAPALH